MRNALLKQVRGNEHWETLREWIKWMVQYEPTIMRQVSKMKFGDLRIWLQRKGENIDPCGCLVGTVAIALIKDRNSFKLRRGDAFTFERSKASKNDEFSYEGKQVDVPTVVCELANGKDQKFVDYLKEQTENAGIAAADLADSLSETDPYSGEIIKDGNEQATFLIKSEIDYQLKIRARRIKATKERKAAKKGR